MILPSEKRFERHIEKSLNNKGYKSLLYTEYDRNLCVIPTELIEFIKSTQITQYDKLYTQFNNSTDQHIFKTLNDDIARRGIVEVIRNGIKTRGSHFELVYFEPKSGLNPDHQELYSKNQFSVVRQLHYSARNDNSIDMVLFLNGIPLITMELKNQLTGQNYKNSEYQYKSDRDSKEPLLRFKRCLAHFCVDNDQVSMTTELNGHDTRFLPYNKGIENPVVKDDYRSEYLWNEVLTPNSLLDIIENYVLLAMESRYEWNEKSKSVVEIKTPFLIFPRYHQLEVTRALQEKIKEEGVGHNYLIQHTTGAGKSYCIGWLSHSLTSLYQSKTDTKRIFDSILVVTDRQVLDEQLQNTIKQLEQTKGVVNPVDINSLQLKDYLEKGKDIIITTVQKFPVISETISQLKSKTFGVIIDEVHSSQSGETSKHMKLSLSKSNIMDEEGNIDYEELIRKEIEARGRQPHISFFGFTGTPKNKTMELFGRKNKEGKFFPFHTYSMRQSIHEGFTLDVLEHYTTYNRYFKLVQKNREDIQLPEGKAMKEVIDYVDSHDEVIRQKVAIILDNFARNTSRKINGKGRGMVVVRSRKHCVLFFREMIRQMREKKFPFLCLVAFSGTVNIRGIDYTENSLNKEIEMKGNNIRIGFKDPRFRILIVSSKFQTGFDEPYLHSMYIDKKLSGVQCVQTLSRLNRHPKGKNDTFILDFVNDTEVIKESFQDFYISTILTGETDPDKLYALQHEIEQFKLFTGYELDEFIKLFYTPSDTDEKLQPILTEVVKKWEALYSEDDQESFRSKIQSFIRLYSFISQIIKFEELEWEKLFVFLKYVNKKLPKGTKEKIDITDAVDLDSLRIQMALESKLSLEYKLGELEPMSPSGSGGKHEEEFEFLSEIIQRINETFGIELTEEDKLDLQNVSHRLVKDEELKKFVIDGDNSEMDRKKFFDDFIKQIFIEYYNDRFEFYNKVEDPKISNFIKDGMYRQYKHRMGA